MPRASKPPKAEPQRVQLGAEHLGVNVHRLLWDGVEAGIREGLEREASKRGMMRGASQGLFLDMETIVGPCHRAALARMIGGEPEREADWAERQLMFDSGHANEDSWVANLRRSWRGPILREEELPIEWRVRTQAGAEAVGSGREDIILCFADDEPGGVPVTLPDGRQVRIAQFVELKQISSINTACDVLFADGKPKLDHGIQVGRYMKEHRVPAQIWYTLPFVLAVPNWSFITPKIPRSGDPFSERVTYGRDGSPTKIQPTAVGYHLTWSDGRLHYCRVGAESGGWTPTVITEEGLDDFWHYTLDMSGFKDLGPRPKNMDILGNREFWDRCSYCSWKPVCDAHEKNYDDWEAAVKERIPSTTSPADKKKEED